MDQIFFHQREQNWTLKDKQTSYEKYKVINFYNP